MPVLNLLQEYEQIQIKVIVALENLEPPVEISLARLSGLLEMSEFTIKKAIQSLAADSQEELSYLYSINLFRGVIRYKRNSTSSPVTALRYIYSRRSDFIRLAETTFLENFTNVDDYVACNNMSRTSFFRKRKTVHDFFTSRNLQLSDKLVVSGDEVTIREYYYHHYSVVFGDFEYPFSKDLKQSASDFISRLSCKLYLHISPAKKSNLLYYTYVSYNRILNGHLIADNTTINRACFSPNDLLFDDTILQATIIAFDSILKENNVHLTDKQLELEAIAYLNFMISTRILSVQLEYIPKLHQVVEPIKAQLAQQFSSFFNLSYWSLQAAFFKGEITSADTYLFHFISYNHPESEVTTDYRSKYLRDNFGDYIEIAKQFVQTQISQLPNRQPDFELNMCDFVNDILYLLIVTVPRHLIEKSVIVTLDFSCGYGYTESLRRKIVAISDYNVIVTDELSSHTDILISDMAPINSDKYVQLEWNNPPTTHDWNLLESALKSFRQNIKTV